MPLNGLSRNFRYVLYYTYKVYELHLKYLIATIYILIVKLFKICMFFMISKCALTTSFL